MICATLHAPICGRQPGLEPASIEARVEAFSGMSVRKLLLNVQTFRNQPHDFHDLCYGLHRLCPVRTAKGIAHGRDGHHQHHARGAAHRPLRLRRPPGRDCRPALGRIGRGGLLPARPPWHRAGRGAGGIRGGRAFLCPARVRQVALPATESAERRLGEPRAGAPLHRHTRPEGELPDHPAAHGRAVAVRGRTGGFPRRDAHFRAAELGSGHARSLVFCAEAGVRAGLLHPCAQPSAAQLPEHAAPAALLRHPA